MSEFPERTPSRADHIVDRCMATHKVCRKTAAYCIDRGGDLATLPRLQALDDCAEINLALANFLLRGSRHHLALAALCRDISQTCADALAPVEHDDGQLRAAFAACQHARQVCDQLLGDDAASDEEAWDEAVRESFPASDPPPTPTEL